MNTIHHLDNYTETISELTGRIIFINNSLNTYLISPSADLSLVPGIVEQWLEKIFELRPEHKPPPGLRRAIKTLGECITHEEFGQALDNLLLAEYRNKLQTSSVGRKQRFLTELLVTLWSFGIIAWPAKDQEPFSCAILSLKKTGWNGSQKSFLIKIRDYIYKGSVDDSANFRFIFDHLLARVGVVDIGDLTPSTFYLREETSRLGKLRSSGIFGILKALREEYPTPAITWTAEDFGFFRAKMGHLARDDNFQWALDRDPSMSHWVRYALEHIQANPANYKKRRSSLNSFMQHLLENPSLPRNPVGYFDIKNRPAPLFFVPGNGGRQTMAALNEFLDEVVVKTCSQPNDDDLPILMPGFANPLAKPIYRGVNKGETHREPMPTKLIRQAIKILTENDFAWTKQIGRIKDSFRWQNPDTGDFETMWSPVRAYALLIKLLLPARSYQVRHIDSGEGDTWRYLSDGSWVLNQGPHRPPQSKIVERGVFRKYKRRDGSEGAVLYFNTNKTADIDSQSKGFVMPWEKRDALKLLSELRDWQERYNPVNAPTAWVDIPELVDSKHRDDLKKMGSSFFLFRDPCHRHRPDLPITDGRLRNLWLKLLDELESRLKAAGETFSNGEPIKLILSREKRGNSPATGAFDLHSLRVTLITAMYEEGVPPEFLMKIVGHSTVLMTLYYIKINAEVLTLRIDEAMQAKKRQERSEMAGFIQRASRQDLEQAVAYRHISAIDAIEGGTGTGMLVMDHGICPVAAKRCHEGLTVTDFATDITKYQAVPGGASNCVRCRFFITGPAFLFGLEALVGDLAYRLRKASYGFEKALGKFDALSDEYAAALETGAPFHKLRELDIVETTFEASTAEVDSIALSLQAAYTLTEQAIRISNRQKESDSSQNGLSLIAVGGTGQIEAVLSETHEFEQIHRICLSATFFEGLRINWQQPNLERARLFDRMLRASGYEPRFCFLDDEDALNVANAMGQFLYARLARDTVHALMDGRTTLREIGMEAVFTKHLEAFEPKTLDVGQPTRLLESTP